MSIYCQICPDWRVSVIKTSFSSSLFWHKPVTVHLEWFHGALDLVKWILKTAQLSAVMSSRWDPVLGLLCMLGGSFCFSLMALVAAELGSGRAAPHKFEPFELVFWRSLFMLVITFSSSAIKGIPPLGPSCTRTRFILIFRGLCGVGFMATYYYSLAVLPMSDAVVLTYTSPVLTALSATLFLGEVWHSLDFLGSALCLTDRWKSGQKNCWVVKLLMVLLNYFDPGDSGL